MHQNEPSLLSSSSGLWVCPVVRTQLWHCHSYTPLCVRASRVVLCCPSTCSAKSPFFPGRRLRKPSYCLLSRGPAHLTPCPSLLRLSRPWQTCLHLGKTWNQLPPAGSQPYGIALVACRRRTARSQGGLVVAFPEQPSSQLAHAEPGYWAPPAGCSVSAADH